MEVGLYSSPMGHNEIEWSVNLRWNLKLFSSLSLHKHRDKSKLIDYSAFYFQ